MALQKLDMEICRKLGMEEKKKLLEDKKDTSQDYDDADEFQIEFNEQ